MIPSLETKSQSKTTCELCSEWVGLNGIMAEEKAFCCHGCKAVYQILETQNQLAYKENHPLLQQAVQFGLISNPILVDKIRLQEAGIRKLSQKWVFEVGGMWCPSCAELIRLMLGQQSGVHQCSVDYITDLACVEFDPLRTSKEQIQKWVTHLGYAVHELNDKSAPPVSFWLILRFAIAAFCALNVMMFSYPLYATYFDHDLEGIQPLLAWISLALTLPVMLFSGFPIYKRMWSQFKLGRLAVEALIGIGTLAALLLSLWEMQKGTHYVYFDTITVVISFLLLGKIIESKAKFSTKSALLRLHRALPRRGRKKGTGGKFSFVPIKDIHLGDEVLALTGERIVLDGTVMAGEGACDESLLTGEVQPVWKRKGDALFSGTIVQAGSLQFRVNAQEKESTLHRILTLVEQAIGHKSVYVHSVDAVVKWFIPIVICISGGMLIMSLTGWISLPEAIQRALAIVLIACPCAVGIAAPYVEGRMLHRFAQKGAIVRNRSLFTLLPKVTHFVFDKTGTVTEGRFQVLSGLEGLSLEEKQCLKSLVTFSIHPIAKAIDQAITVLPNDVSRLREISGRGIEGEWKGQLYHIGSHRFAKEQGLSFHPPSQESAAVYFFTQDRLISTIALGDRVQPDAFEVVQKLIPLKRILLSGDHALAVKAVAEKLGFDDWRAEASPLEKQIYVSQLKSQGYKVAMMGDGINDAPALAKADVAISAVSATDLSIHVSDLILTTDKLNLILELRDLVCQGSRLMRQNLFWAFAYNVIGIGMAITGILTPLFASFAMIISSLFVLFNGRRI